MRKCKWESLSEKVKWNNENLPATHRSRLPEVSAAVKGDTAYCSTSFFHNLSLVCPKKSRIFIGQQGFELKTLELSRESYLDGSASVLKSVFLTVQCSKLLLSLIPSLPQVVPWEIVRPEFLSRDLGDTIRLTATGFVANDMVIVTLEWIVSQEFFLSLLFVFFLERGGRGI